MAAQHSPQTLGLVSAIWAGPGQTHVPDLLLFRKEGNKLKIDILDPHDESSGDAAEKAADLAEFTRKHGAAFDRIELIRVANGKIERLRLHQESIRDKVL